MARDGRIALVTGAARGIGRAIALALSSRCAAVALVDVLEAELEETAEAIREDGGRAQVLPTDITDAAQVEAMAQAVQDELGPPDIVVNNAGTFSVIGPVWECDPDRWFRDVRTNLYGSFLVTRSLVKSMVDRESGYVINIVSSGGVGDPHPFSTSYACSKTGLMRLTEGLAAETREHGVKVFAVGPPAIRSEMTRFIAFGQEGKRWRPGFDRIFEEESDVASPAIVGDLILRLIGGEADALTGRYLEPHRDLDALLSRVEEVIEKDLHTLRIRR